MLFGLAVRLGSAAGLAVITATGSLVWSLTRSESQRLVKGASTSRGINLRILISSVVFAVLGALQWSPSFFGPTSIALEVVPWLTWIALAGVLYLNRNSIARWLFIGTVVSVLVATLLVGLAHISFSGEAGIDVFHLHVKAAAALSQGDNPYTEAVVVPDGSPLAGPDDVIQGYVYPPTTMLAYAVGQWLFSDPRAISLLSWMGFLAVLGVSAIRRMSPVRLHAMLFLACLPGWPLVLRASWTEPFTLLTVALAWLLWNGAAPSGTALGLSLASKQYFIVAAPLFLAHRDRKVWKRNAIALAIPLLTVSAAILVDAQAYWSSTVEFHASTPPRPDSSNLVGLLSLLGVPWDPPFWLAPAVGLVTAWKLGLVSTTPDSFIGATAAALAVTFLVSSQAFANYWFLIFGMTALALVGLVERCASNEGVRH